LDSPLAALDQLFLDASDAPVLQAAAAVTQQSRDLLGIKSIGVEYGLVKTGIASMVGWSKADCHFINDKAVSSNFGHCQIRTSNTNHCWLASSQKRNRRRADSIDTNACQKFDAMYWCGKNWDPKNQSFWGDERYTSK
jgi:hypothetical protein